MSVRERMAALILPPTKVNLMPKITVIFAVVIVTAFLWAIRFDYSRVGVKSGYVYDRWMGDFYFFTGSVLRKVEPPKPVATEKPLLSKEEASGPWMKYRSSGDDQSDSNR